MSCPHGHLEAGSCPECGPALNVKPLQLASKATFTRLDPAAAGVDAREQAPVSRTNPRGALPTGVLRPSRLLPGEDLRIAQPGNSSHLHARLQQLLPDPASTGIPREAIEQRLKLVRTSRFNPMVDTR